MGPQPALVLNDLSSFEVFWSLVLWTPVHMACLVKRGVCAWGRRITETVGVLLGASLQGRHGVDVSYDRRSQPRPRRVVSVGFPHCQATVFPFVVNKYLGESV